MSLFDSFDPQMATVVGFGINTLLITAEPMMGPLTRRLAGLGCRIETCDELYYALDRVMDGPQEFELVVIDCDGVGGLGQGTRAHALLKAAGRSLPVLLISGECETQSFPFSRYEPTVLRAPISSVSLRVGFEHAMQERLLMARAS